MKYIYKITNLINNKMYIGQTNNVNRRWNEHRTKNTNSIIHKAIQKYGEENFKIEVLEKTVNPDEDELKWIVYFNSVHEGYNINLPLGTSKQE